MIKSELHAELTKRGIEYDPNAKNVELEELLENAPPVKEDAPKEDAPAEESSTEETPKEEPKESKAPEEKVKPRNKSGKEALPPTGSRDVEVPPGYKKVTLAEDEKEKELTEFQDDKRLRGWDPVKREAVVRIK